MWATIEQEERDKAEFRKQKEAESGLTPEDENEVEIIPWIAESYAEIRKLEARQRVKQKETIMIRNAYETYKKRMARSYTRRVTRGLLWD